jgi:hypothetical protein
MPALSSARPLDRYGRHVRRARLSIAPDAPARTLAFTVEEALRLASLPGENEGRCYYFRRLRVRGLPADGDRAAWLGQFQRALAEQAAEAVHAADPRAESAAAVYFHGEQEALEILLCRAIARRESHEWFWPMVMGQSGRGGAARTAAPAQIVPILERLRAAPAGWVAVAAALFAAGEIDAVRLLRSIPPLTAQSWLREIAPRAPRLKRASPAGFEEPPVVSRTARLAIAQALKTAGPQDPRTIWLAAMAILFESPAELAAGRAIERAVLAIQAMVAEERQDAIAPSTVFESVPAQEQRAVADSLKPAPSAEAIKGETSPQQAEPRAAAPVSQAASPESVSATPVAPTRETPATSELAASPACRASRAVNPWQCIGEPTAAGGLFFLLHVLDSLGLPAALADGLLEASPQFTARLLRSLAAHAITPAGDPVVLWLDSMLALAPLDEPADCPRTWLPQLSGAGLLACAQVSRKASAQARRPAPLHRLWSVAVRRWCWRNARISARDIVTRPGIFSVNRTDLDVSLPIYAAEIRIRRAGLDLDPGWLPWFGRVVRFHYLLRGEFDA